MRINADRNTVEKSGSPLIKSRRAGLFLWIDYLALKTHMACSKTYSDDTVTEDPSVSWKILGPSVLLTLRLSALISEVVKIFFSAAEIKDEPYRAKTSRCVSWL